MDNLLEMKEDQPPTLPVHAPKMPTRINWQSIQIVFNVINHILISIVSIYMTYVAYSNGNVAVSWHVFLCTTGVSYLNK